MATLRKLRNRELPLTHQVRLRNHLNRASQSASYPPNTIYPPLPDDLSKKLNHRVHVLASAQLSLDAEDNASDEEMAADVLSVLSSTAQRLNPPIRFPFRYSDQWTTLLEQSETP